MNMDIGYFIKKVSMGIFLEVSKFLGILMEIAYHIYYL